MEAPTAFEGIQFDGHDREPTIPRYGSGCVSDIMPYVLGEAPAATSPLGIELTGAPTVLLVLDGLGWDQLQDRLAIAPVLAGAEGGSITTVAPSTTATALTSITTGLTPGEHGVVGYRMMVDDEVLNCLRWGTKSRPDARKTSPPDMLQPYEPFLGNSVAMVSKAEFRRSGFTQAHLRGARLTGYRTTAVMVHEIGRLLRGGEQFVYAYYDGVDKVSHEYGLGAEYNAELRFVDRLVGDVAAVVPSGTQIIVTADHGQVDCGNNLLPLAPSVKDRIDALSGEGRFRWLHARPGAVEDLAAAALEEHGDLAWVRTAEQMVDERWFGPSVRAEVMDRLGDVALLPFAPVAFEDPDDSGPFELIGRHGSLTAAEMLVPLLSITA